MEWVEKLCAGERFAGTTTGLTTTAWTTTASTTAFVRTPMKHCAGLFQGIGCSTLASGRLFHGKGACAGSFSANLEQQ